MSTIAFPKIALGAWAWGNDGTFGGALAPEDLKPVFDAGQAAGLNLWDTAYAYGMGTSEKILSEFVRGVPRESVLISDKFTPQCVTEPPSERVLTEMHARQLALIGLDRFDLYWIHNAVDAPRWTEALARHFEGRADAPVLGVSNHDLAEIKEADAILRAHGLRLGAVQNHYSLVNRSSETSGILAWCRENGVAFFGYMVLEQGALTGRFDTRHPMPEGSARAAAYNPVLDKLEVLNAELARVAAAHGVGIAPVPVAWAVSKGAIPIIGATKARHVADAAAAAAVALAPEETASLEATADTLGLSSVRFWEKEMK